MKVLSTEVEKYKALVDCYKSEIKYSSELLTKTNKEKTQILQENKYKAEELNKLKS